jgi:hypothetical protein
MFPHRIVPTLALIFVLATPSARAFFDPPWITPAAPRVGETVSVNIHGGICDGVIEWPGYPQILRNGNEIRIVEYGVHEGSEDWCIYPVGTLTVPIGAFPAGNYSLTVDFTYDNYPFGLGTITLGVIPFTVTGVSAAAPVPTSSVLGRIAFLLLISVPALWTLRMRRRSRC